MIEQPTSRGERARIAVTAAEACEVTLALIKARGPAATVCPSEVAKALAAAAGAYPAGEAWRNAMPAVHAAVDRLTAEGRVKLSWKGEALIARAGPYRICRSSRG